MITFDLAFVFQVSIISLGIKSKAVGLQEIRQHSAAIAISALIDTTSLSASISCREDRFSESRKASVRGLKGPCLQIAVDRKMDVWAA